MSCHQTSSTNVCAYYPIGHIITTENPNNPVTYLGFGTWISYGTGQVLVGIDTTQTEFTTVGQTGGEKTHALSTNEMPQHNHGGHLAGRQMAISTGSGITCVDPGTTGSWFDGQSIRIDNTGGNASHNNLQPYITVYMWKRTA